MTSSAELAVVKCILGCCPINKMATSQAGAKFRLALVQLFVGADKSSNLANATKCIKEAASKGARMIVLPECFNSPYGTQYFSEYSEPIPGQSTDCLAAIAKETSTYIVGGSIPERDGDKIYNTCTVFGPNGDLLTKFRKCHLFDIDVPGKITFKESDVLTQGSNLGIFDTEWCKVGVGICYDLRFPELAAIYAKRGVKLLLYPGAFNMTTGPAHWELLLRGRALDNQFYVGGVCCARDTSASYVAWGHSTLVSPWGVILAKADEKETILYEDIDLSVIESTRKSIPTSLQKRHDLYKLEDLAA